MSTIPSFPDIPDIDFDFELDEAIQPAAPDHYPAPNEADEALELVMPVPDIYSLLPMPYIELTASERETVQRYQLGRIILGPVADAVMQCPPPIPPDVLDTLAPATVTSLIQKLKICPFELPAHFSSKVRPLTRSRVRWRRTT